MKNKQRTPALYEQSGIYGDEAMITSSAYNRLGKMLELLGRLPEPPRRILDLGCGDGYLSNLLQQHYPQAEIWGIDISKTAIAAGNKKYKNINFILGDAEKKLPFTDNFFDIVISGEHIEHLRDVDTYLEEINRVTKDYGYLLMTTPNLASWINRILLLFGRQPWYLEASLRKNLPIFQIGSFVFPINPYTPAVGHLRLFSLDILKKLLALYGFNLAKVKGAKIMMKPGLKQLDTFFSWFPSLAFGLVVLAQKKDSLQLTPPKKKLTVSIGIPAYNSEKNITGLLTQITHQDEETFHLKKITVYSDGSSDNTVANAKKVKDKRIEVLAVSERKGFAHGFKTLINSATTDVFILLNDDISIKNDQFIGQMVTQFTNSRVGLVSGNPRPFLPNNFIQKAAYSTFRAYDVIRYAIRNGNNKYTCDGKVLALSREFIRALEFPAKDSLMGNVDAYLYYFCISRGFEYKHARKAIVYFLYPQTVSEYVRWNTRNRMNSYILRESFGEQINDVDQVPRPLYLSSLFVEFIAHPLESAYVYILGIYCRYKARQHFSSFSETWDVIATTKKSISGTV